MAKMEFIAVMDGQEHRLSVDEHDQDLGEFKITLDGTAYKIDAQTLPSEIISAIIDNKSYDIDVDDKDQSNDPLDGRLAVRVRGRVLRLEMLEKRRKKMQEARSVVFSQDKGAMPIISPMPGRVLRYLVKAGDSIEKGQGLVVVEAMKMENEISSPKNGVVKSIAALELSAVENGAVLLTIE